MFLRMLAIWKLPFWNANHIYMADLVFSNQLLPLGYYEMFVRMLAVYCDQNDSYDHSEYNDCYFIANILGIMIDLWVAEIHKWDFIVQNIRIQQILSSGNA